MQQGRYIQWFHTIALFLFITVHKGNLRNQSRKKKAEGNRNRPARNQQQCGAEVPAWQCKLVGVGHDQTVG